MNIIETKIKAGASEPFRLLHISDTHLTLADGRDGQRKLDLAADRSNYFLKAEEYLDEACKMAKSENIPIVHTGDLIDFVSKANLERAKQFTSENDVFFATGNHEFSLYVGEAFEDEAYRNQSLSLVQEYFPDNIRFCKRTINGVKLIGIDDGYYRFDKAQLDSLKNEVEEGLPIILFLHNPHHEPELYRLAMTKGSCAYLTSTPEELMKDYDEYRYRQQKADEITLETTRFIESCPLIKAIFAGHLHYDYEGIVDGHLPQYVTGIGTARIIEVE